MKIITNTRRNGKLCYVQVKDILFLARYTSNKRLMQDYLNAINNGKSDDEFVKVSGNNYIRAFELCDYIIDFSEYSKRDIGVNYLSNMVKNKAYAMPKDKIGQEGLDLQIDAVRDMIAYKMGTLDYKIPLVADGDFEFVSPDQTLLFNSTVVDGCYTLSTLDGKDVNTHDYDEFFKGCIDKVYDALYPELPKDERDYKYYDRGRIFVLNIHVKEIKKNKGVVGKILAKIKKTQD